MEDEVLTSDYSWKMYSSIHGVAFPERDIAKFIHTYVPPFLIFIGTFGNIISAVILHRLYNHVLSTALYLFIIVIVDLFVLYILCGNVWIKHLTGLDIKHFAILSSNSMCKIYPFIADFVLHLSIWMAVAMVIETTVVTMRPPQLLRMCNLERARAVILLIIVLLVCVNAHCFWSFSLLKKDKPTPTTEVCTMEKQANQNSEEFRKIVWPVMKILVADLLPYCVIFSCTVMLITKRCRRIEQIRELETIWKTFSAESKSAMQVHVSIITICVFYLVLMLAKLGNNIFHFLIDSKSLGLVESSLVLESRKTLADAVCATLMYIFISCKFFMLLASSACFRQEFVLLITCQRCCPRRIVATNSRSSSSGSQRVSKNSHESLLHPVNNVNHNSATGVAGATGVGGLVEHGTIPQINFHPPPSPAKPVLHLQLEQTDISLCHSEACQQNCCTDTFTRKQIYSMTAV